MNLPKVILILSLNLACNHLSAQVRQMSFTNLNGVGGLPLGQVNDIKQDKYGFMWFSEETAGSLTRFDGSELKRFAHDPGNSNSLGGTYPECLFIDGKGFIWIGFYGQGLDRYDPTTNSFTHYRHDPGDPGSIINDTVTSIIQDRSGQIYAGSYGGLSILDNTTGKFINYQSNETDTTSLSSRYVRRVYEDKQGTIWVGAGWWFDENDIGGLNKFHSETGKFTRYLYDPDNETGLKHRRVFDMFEDSDGNFWLGTDGPGLYTMDRDNGVFHSVELSGFEMLGNNWTNFIIEDRIGDLWLGISSEGIYRYDKKTQKIDLLTDGRDQSGNLIQKGGWCAYIEADGMIWLSLQPGVYMVDPDNTLIPYKQEPLVHYIEESQNVWWTGLHNGLERYDRTIDVVQRFRSGNGSSGTLSSDTITSLFISTDSILWVGTASGLDRYDLRTQDLSKNVLKSIANQDAISSIYEDSDQNLWIGTENSGLVKWINPGPNNPDYSSTEIALRGEEVFRIAEDQRNDIWLGTHAGSGALRKIEQKNGALVQYHLGNWVSDVLVDGDGVIWAVSSSGLFKLDAITDNFMNVVSEPVLAVTLDSKDNLWTSSPTGVYHINENRAGIRKYGGLNLSKARLTSFSSTSHIDIDGNIYLGDANGYYVFHPDSIHLPIDESTVHITNFWLGNNQLSPYRDGPLTKSLTETDEIRLAHDENTFSMSFAEIDYRNEGPNKIQFQMINYDADWRETTANERISYVKVPPGNYPVVIRASNSSTGQWAERKFTIIISPPWWNTWWSYLFYGIILVLGIIGVDRYQRRRLVRKERERTKDRELAQAKEIEKAYTELKSTQTQLIHSEKMASLGELTAGIAHEIQNPLNFVNNFSDVNKELLDELDEEIEKGDKDEIKTIMSNIRENEDKVTHHGKRAEAIVKSMLQHSRGGEGTKKPTDINTLCDEYLRLAYHGFRAKDQSFNADFKTELDPDLPKIEVVPQDIGRVLLNLINNAFQAVKDVVQPEVVVSTTHVSPSGGGKGEVRISVKDNGPGIPDDIKEKIFQPFFTTKPTGEGTGLGLSMSYDIVTKGHGGTVEVETEVGLGTEFIIELPINST